VRSHLSVGISFGPFLETAQLKVLILQGVRQLVGHHWFLTVEIDPVGR
jgi:hypothetical protein